ELGEQSLPLPVAQPAQTPARSDLQPLHDLRRTHLADAGQGLQQGGHLHLAQDLVVVRRRQHLLEGGAAALEALLELSPSTTGSSSLLQCCGALLVAQLGKSHDFLRGVGTSRISAATVPTASDKAQRGVRYVSAVSVGASTALR